jgi:hypothetical protein
MTDKDTPKFPETVWKQLQSDKEAARAFQTAIESRLTPYVRQVSAGFHRIADLVFIAEHASLPLTGSNAAASRARGSVTLVEEIMTTAPRCPGIRVTANGKSAGLVPYDGSVAAKPARNLKPEAHNGSPHHGP